MNKKYNRIWSFALAGMLGISCSIPVPVHAAVQSNTESIQQGKDSSETSEGVQAAFLYAELSEYQATQNVVIKLNFEHTPESAVLFSEVSGKQEETSALQIIENYISFSLPASDCRTFQKIEFSVDGMAYTTSLLPLENGTQIEQDVFEEAVSEEPAVAAFSLDNDSSEPIESCVITSTLNEEISAQEIASSVSTTLSPENGATTDTSSADDEIKVIVLDPGHGAAGTGTYRKWSDFIIDEAVINYKITTYTKEALEANYANIAVYTTKVSQNENPSLEKRVRYAVDKQADIFVSQHVNATGEQTTKANGVLAMVPKLDASHNYHHDAAEASLDMARSILDELVTLGFRDMGFQERLTENGSKYSDGSYADYYGIVKHCRENNLPGAIIEHGFANNRNDALKLNNENMLKEIGKADARGIAAYLNLSAGTSSSPSDNTGVAGHNFSNNNNNNNNSNNNNNNNNNSSIKTGWQKIDNEWYYYDTKGKVTTGWQKIDGKWYYMNSKGVRQTGWQKIDGQKYYLNSDGIMATGWLLLDKNWYYLNGSGVMLTGWIMLGNTWYYLNSPSGIMAADTWIDSYYVDSTGAWIEGKTPDDSSSESDSSSIQEPAKWILTGSRWKYRHEDGSYTCNNWEKINGTWYLFDKDGWMLTGWQTFKGTKYYLNADGAMVVGWLHLNNNWYYLDGSGAMLTGWQKIGNTWYYLNSPSGIMAADTWIGSYYVDSNGAWIEGKTQNTTSSGSSKWILSGNRWWYRHKDGSYTRNGWEKINGIWYLFDADGWMLTGWQKVKGIWYYMDASGAMLTGWQKLGGTWYYLDASGAMLTGTHTIGGKTYTFQSSGALVA